jgi:adenosyl cobinamide kinase/adenosyl cobinamide phosphate guanylyltransferase
MSMKSAVVTIVTDPETGELILPLDHEIFDETGWEIGDTLEWIDQKNGSWVLRKKEMAQEKEWVLVECVSTFRERYMVQVPKGKKEWAMDTVVMHEAKEFSQEHLGEQIVSHRVVSEEDALKMCDEDNEYARSWSDEHKINTFFTKEGEKEKY